MHSIATLLQAKSHGYRPDVPGGEAGVDVWTYIGNHKRRNTDAFIALDL